MNPVPAHIQSLRQQGPALVETLSTWSGINSGSQHIAGLERMRLALKSTFSVLTGATIEEVPLQGTEARALRVRCRPEAPTQVLLSGHYDTVFGETHAFQAPLGIDGDRLVGPGVSDMKGGLLVMFTALKVFEQSPAASQVGWEALLTPDEEIGSNGSAPVLLEAARRHQIALVFEPARPSGDLVRSRMGSGVFTVTSYGKAAHAGQFPSPGRNAIVALSEFVLRAQKLPETLPGVIVNVGQFAGGGPVNVVPDFARAEFNLRTTKASDGPASLAYLNGIAAEISLRDGHRLAVEGKFDCTPMEAGPVSERAFDGWQDCAADLGLTPFTWIHTGGASDGNLLASTGIPVLDGLGPIGGQLHTSSEYCVVSSLHERAQTAALWLTRLAEGKYTLKP